MRPRRGRIKKSPCLRKTLAHKCFKRDQPHDKCARDRVGDKWGRRVCTWHVGVCVTGSLHYAFTHKLPSLCLPHSRFIHLFIFAYRLRLYMLGHVFFSFGFCKYTSRKRLYSLGKVNDCITFWKIDALYVINN